MVPSPTNPNAVDPAIVHAQLVTEHGPDAPDFSTVRRILLDGYRIGLIDRPVV